jgi:hypothetical protein
MIIKSEAYTVTNDHLLKAYTTVSTEFWKAHARITETFDNKTEQLEAINELVRFGDAMVKINEARSALF